MSEAITSTAGRAVEEQPVHEARLDLPVRAPRDGDVDLDDYAMYLSGLHKDLSGLTADEAFAKGDLNGDGVNDFADFVLFRAAYNTAHGAGSFAAASPVLSARWIDWPPPAANAKSPSACQPSAAD